MSDNIESVESDDGSEMQDAIGNLTDGGMLARKIPDVQRLETFEEVARSLVESGAALVDTADLADGYTLLKDKDQLVGSEFIITGHHVKISEEFSAEYSIIRLITKATNSRVVITDGSTGIHQQLLDVPEDTFVYCRNGLLRSDYPANDTRPAGTTYYLDTSGGRLPAGTL